MIVRLWRGIVDASRAEEARRYEAEIGIPAYRSIAGNQGIYMLGRRLGERYEIAMLTLWNSWDSVRAFAGDPIDRANYDEYRRRRLDYLIEPAENVEHFEVLVTANTPEQRSGGHAA